MANQQTDTLVGKGFCTLAQSWIQQAASVLRGSTQPTGQPPSKALPTSSPAGEAFAPRKTLRALNFICRMPEAKSVSLVGDFNAWNPTAHPMRQMPDGAWLLKMELKHGYHRYAFLVDGQLVLDPRAQGTTRNDKGQAVSLVPVS